MGTPHNSAEPGEIARTVLMPGDPFRAEFIAKNWLTDVKLVNQIRNIYAFTGRYHDTEVTVMASGMGMPSIGIYSYELFAQYNVDEIIRIGTAGPYCDRLKLYDVVLAEGCWSESSYAATQNGDASDTKYPDQQLNQIILDAGNLANIQIKPAKIHSSDVFYRQPEMESFRDFYEKHGCECVEMESFALFHNAQVLGKRAACLLTISDSFVTGEKTSAEERRSAFGSMMEAALKAAEILGKRQAAMK